MSKPLVDKRSKGNDNAVCECDTYEEGPDVNGNDYEECECGTYEERSDVDGNDYEESDTTEEELDVDETLDPQPRDRQASKENDERFWIQCYI